jgi:hypothetical protein
MKEAKQIEEAHRAALGMKMARQTHACREKHRNEGAAACDISESMSAQWRLAKMAA